MLKGIIFFIFALVHLTTHAVDTCSRIAIINYQEVLVDTNSTEKGEGLRYHLEKDPVAKSYLDKYQQGTQIRWENAVLGTVGTGLLIGGALVQSGGSKSPMIIGGIATMIVNFLLAKTFENSNEENLNKAIEEYNKRNLPKIYFNPGQSSSKDRDNTVSLLLLNKSWTF